MIHPRRRPGGLRPAGLGKAGLTGWPVSARLPGRLPGWVCVQGQGLSHCQQHLTSRIPLVNREQKQEAPEAPLALEKALQTKLSFQGLIRSPRRRWGPPLQGRASKWAETKGKAGAAVLRLAWQQLQRPALQSPACLRAELRRPPPVSPSWCWWLLLWTSAPQQPLDPGLRLVYGAAPLHVFSAPTMGKASYLLIPLPPATLTSPRVKRWGARLSQPLSSQWFGL